MEFKPRITHIGDVQQVGQNNTSKLNFLAEEIAPGKQYLDTGCFEVFGDDKVEAFQSAHKVGDEVLIKFNLRGREHNGRLYGSCQAWKVESLASNHSGSDDKF